MTQIVLFWQGCFEGGWGRARHFHYTFFRKDCSKSLIYWCYTSFCCHLDLFKHYHHHFQEIEMHYLNFNFQQVQFYSNSSMSRWDLYSSFHCLFGYYQYYYSFPIFIELCHLRHFDWKSRYLLKHSTTKTRHWKLTTNYIWWKFHVVRSSNFRAYWRID